MTRHILTVDDLESSEIELVLRRAAKHKLDRKAPRGPKRVVGILFLEASLRTRVGFTVAAHRLGWYAVDVTDRRAAATSMPESWQDTLRTLSGYVDQIIARLGQPLNHASLVDAVTVPLLNGGDTGPAAEHPSQALIDVFAMEQLVGPIETLHVTLCGDLRMRSARSLISIMSRRPPRKLSVLTVDALRFPAALPDSLLERVEFREPSAVDDVDVLYVIGIPHGAVDEQGRTRLRVDRRMLSRLPADAVVLSPMPVIDEIAWTARGDSRMRLFEQSDGGLFVRMALHEFLAGRLG